ncbi:hypothetical protein RchiOBHm_Chr3g0480791 [Rosa chinensis]|uniref:Uncharacterized protein n=1 Tax=Rosa chinensis TaxID=74649 RepID=A0A2P6RDT6_ROSCH|nr:hypothetical protein RchiOBHm_Chr3g0480791 [Rosa chinensis]
MQARSPPAPEHEMDGDVPSLRTGDGWGGEGRVEWASCDCCGSNLRFVSEGERV